MAEAQPFVPDIERGLGLVRSILRDHFKVQLHWTPYDDLFQMGCIGLWQAIERFDPSRGVAFVTFAHKRVYGAVIDGLRETEGLGRLREDGSRKNKFFPMSMTQVIANFGENWSSTGRFTSPEDHFRGLQDYELGFDVVEEIDFAENVAGPLCDVLHGKEMDVARLLSRGLNQKQIARQLHLTEARISQIVASMRRKALSIMQEQDAA